MRNLALPIVTAAGLVFAHGALAQGALVGTEALDDRIDDIQEDIGDDLADAEDAQRFGPEGFRQGWAGAVSLGVSATSGNTDTADLSFGGRLTYGMGPMLHRFGIGVEIAEDNDVRNKEEVFATYEFNRYFNDRFYLFGLGLVTYDDFSSNEIDSFLGFGPGYRVIAEQDMTWRVQAGVGARYVRDQNDNDNTEPAFIASSRYYVSVTDTTYVTNDTDFLYSDDSFVATNELGVNFRVTDTLSTRFSLRTEYDDEPLPGLDNTDNTLKLSLVSSF